MKKLKALLQKLDDLLIGKKYIDAGALDLSGQGRNKYGK